MSIICCRHGHLSSGQVAPVAEVRSAAWSDCNGRVVGDGRFCDPYKWTEHIVFILSVNANAIEALFALYYWEQNWEHDGPKTVKKQSRIPNGNIKQKAVSRQK